MTLTGQVIDRILRPEPLSEQEIAFAEWAASRGLAVVFSNHYPDDDDDFEPYHTYVLVREEVLADGRIYAFQMTVEPTDHQPQRDVYEQLLLAGAARDKERRGFA